MTKNLVRCDATLIGTMTVKDCKPGDATCAQDMDPFLSQDSENLLGRVLAGMCELIPYCIIFNLPLILL